MTVRVAINGFGRIGRLVLRAIIESDRKDINVVAINDKLLSDGSLISDPKIPFTIEVLEYYINCTAILRDNPGREYRGFAERFSLLKIDNVKERELNHSGITFKISNSGDSMVDGIYSLLLEQQIPEIIKIKDNEYRLDLRRERTYLPFNLELVDFKKEMHPGTDIAKSFSSNINLDDNNIERSVLIEMNIPLRYKNYTFYQSAFRENSGYDTTILSVVKNYGRLFPYISTIIMSLGLLLQMVLRLPRLFSERKKRVK